VLGLEARESGLRNTSLGLHLALITSFQNGVDGVTYTAVVSEENPSDSKSSLMELSRMVQC
jgi:hypothetical protein